MFWRKRHRHEWGARKQLVSNDGGHVINRRYCKTCGLCKQRWA